MNGAFPNKQLGFNGVTCILLSFTHVINISTGQRMHFYFVVKDVGDRCISLHGCVYSQQIIMLQTTCLRELYCLPSAI